jgi:hypothetical protein
MKQAAAIIQSEGVFIDSSPLGKLAASKQTLQTSSIFELRSGALRIFERRSALEKACVERLLKRARMIQNRAVAKRVVGSERVSRQF